VAAESGEEGRQVVVCEEDMACGLSLSFWFGEGVGGEGCLALLSFSYCWLTRAERNEDGGYEGMGYASVPDWEEFYQRRSYQFFVLLLLYQDTVQILLSTKPFSTFFLS